MNITSIKEFVGIIFAAAATAITALFGAHTGIMKILMIFMVVDYITGLIVAGIFKKSQKTENGAIESRASLKGLFRKGMMILIVYIALQVDLLIGEDYLTMATIYFFIANELISLIENFGLMGVPFPEPLKDAVEILKKKSTKIE